MACSTAGARATVTLTPRSVLLVLVAALGAALVHRGEAGRLLSSSVSDFLAVPAKCVQGTAPVEVASPETIVHQPTRDALECASWCHEATNYTFYAYTKDTERCACLKEFLGVLPASPKTHQKAPSQVVWGLVSACATRLLEIPRQAPQAPIPPTTPFLSGNVKVPNLSSLKDNPTPPSCSAPESCLPSLPKAAPKMPVFAASIPRMPSFSFEFASSAPGFPGHNSVDNFISTADLYGYQS